LEKQLKPHQLQGPLNVQLAIQGGGAKLVTLIAAMEAVQDLQADGLIKVTRVAGASAGALVGCLFAAGIRMSTLRTRLRNLTKKQLARLFPTSKKMLFLRLSRRMPGWNDGPLKRELTKWFKEVNVVTFGDLKGKIGIEAIVIAANLTTASKKIYRDDDELVVASILSSCGLPYFLRVWHEGEVIVDGGICENFPAEELLDDSSKGEVLGITFHPTESNPNSLVNFTTALLETAMNHSMNRAKRQLGVERVFTINTNINTFGFDKALDGLESEYDLVKHRARDFFVNYVDSVRNQQVRQVVVPETWESAGATIMENLHKVYTSQHEPSKLRYKLGRFIVHANCLVTDEASYLYKSAPDHIEYFFTFETTDDNIYCHAIGLSEANHDVSLWGRTEFEAVNNGTGTPIELVSLPMNKTPAQKEKSLLLYFLPHLPSNSGPYTLKCTELVLDLMKPLLEKNEDFLSINPLRAAGNIERLEIILCLPKEFGEVHMTCNITDQKSRPMNAGELSLVTILNGFKAIGWVVEHMPPDKQIIVTFSK
jgi:predicted acylesterase/phospholipase RssA